MLYQILSHTPTWVFGLFLALLALGLSQTRDGRVGLARIAVMPLAMGALSLYGTFSAFGASASMLAVWLLAASLSAAWLLRRPIPSGIRFDRASRSLQVPGSWIPLLLMMGIFSTKYSVGVLTAMHPELLANGGFDLTVATLYGAFSGLFAARALRMWRLVWTDSAALAAV